MATCKDMLPAIGQSVAVRFEEILVNCTVRNVKSSYGRTRLLVTPTQGMGEQWVELPRVSKLRGAGVTTESKRIPESRNQTELLKLAEDVIHSADDAGCSEDLTVVSKQAIGLLEDWIVNRFGFEETA